MRSKPPARSSFLRVPYVQRCRVEIGGRRQSGMLCNLSALGVYLHLEQPPELGTEVILRFPLPDGGDPIEALAAVTWVNDAPPADLLDLPVGCGLRFLEVAPDERRRLRAVVEAYRAVPEPMIGVVQPASGRARVPFIASCVLTGAFGEARGETCNLSTMGLYVAVQPIPAPGQQVRVALKLPRHAGSFERAAIVTWQNLDQPDRPHALPPGCGLRFEDLTEADHELLAALVTEYLESLPPEAVKS